MNRTTFFFRIVFISLTVHFAVYGQSCDSLVQAAWNAWERNDQKEVEKLFRTAIQIDNSSTRAHLGLSYLYTLQEKNDEAWTEFNYALQYLPDKYPYIFSAWLTPKFLHNSDKEKAGVIKLLESLTEDTRAVKDIRAAACDVAGEYYESKQNLSKAKEYFNKEKTINEWMLIGPFENISASGYDQVFPPEKEYKPKETYEGKSNTPVWWFKVPAIRNDYWVDLTYNFSYSDAIYYGNTFIFSPSHQKVWVRVGTSGSLKAFLNDELILSCFDESNNDLDTYIAETELQEGWNRLLIKCGYSEISQCNFKVRITDTSGYPLQGLKVATDPQQYNKMPRAAIHQIPNFAEEFFKQKIAANPNEPENYLLLADCYLRNDKAIDAELILRKAIQRSPHCAVFYEHLIEAYIRGKKYDEREQILEKLIQMDQQIPVVLNYQINRSLQNEEYDEVDRYIYSLEKLLPESEDVLQHKIDLYSKRNYVEKLVETANKAVEKYPDNWQFVYLKAYIASQLTRKPSESIKVIENYLSRNYDRTALYYLADFYLQANDLDNWEKTFKKLLELQPAAPGYYFHMAEIYTSAQNLSKAENSISEAIRVCPGNSAYWNKRGEILRMKSDIEGAKSAYREALRLNQSNRDAREALRELENKGSIYSNFESVDIHSLVKNAPSSSEYPNDPAIYLLDDMRRVVYERGASEYTREILIKVFNNRGIDAFKEYSIGYNSYNENFNIDKAVVIKHDGSEIKADVNQNQVVFKSLEPNDIVYLKFRVSKLYGGMLAKHFWDSYYFNYFYPIKLIRYSLLVPDGTVFQHITQNMPDEPQLKKTKDGTLYCWSSTNEPAIDDEPNLPALKEIGKILQVSTIESWQEIADWFTGIAETKTRTSYEIKEQVDSLFMNKKGLSGEQKAEIIYNYITEHIRYSSVSFRQSALIPQKARDVLVNRIGDCKDVATLYIAMLREEGIKGYYVLVNTRDEGTCIKTLPSINFNHCIVAVDLPEKLQFCDLTAHYHSFKTMPDGDIEGFYLLIKPGEKEPHYINPKQFPVRKVYRKTSIILHEDNSATIQKKFIRYGAASAYYREEYQNKSYKEQEEQLTTSLMRDYPSVKLISFEIKNIEEKKETTELDFSCEVPNVLSDAGQFKIFKIPWTDAFDKWPALSRDARNYPLQFWVDIDTLSEELSISLPKGYKFVDAGSKSSISNSVCDYKMNLSEEKNILKGNRQVVNKKFLIMPDEYGKFRDFYNKVVSEDGRQILIKKR